MLVSWQFPGPYGVTKYGSGWRKDVVNQYLEFGVDNQNALYKASHSFRITYATRAQWVCWRADNSAVHESDQQCKQTAVINTSDALLAKAKTWMPLCKSQKITICLTIQQLPNLCLSVWRCKSIASSVVLTNTQAQFKSYTVRTIRPGLHSLVNGLRTAVWWSIVVEQT